MEFAYIMNPETGRRVKTNGILGKKIIRNYFIQSGGGRKGSKKADGGGDNLKTFWNNISIDKKCQFCAELKELDETNPEKSCTAYNKKIENEKNESAAKLKLKLDGLKAEMSTAMDNESRAASGKNFELAIENQDKARGFAYQIAEVTNDKYEDPYGKGLLPKGYTKKEVAADIAKKVAKSHPAYTAATTGLMAAKQIGGAEAKARAKARAKANRRKKTLSKKGKVRKKRSKNVSKVCGFDNKTYRCSKRMAGIRGDYCYTARNLSPTGKRFCKKNRRSPKDPQKQKFGRDHIANLTHPRYTRN